MGKNYHNLLSTFSILYLVTLIFILSLYYFVPCRQILAFTGANKFQHNSCVSVNTVLDIKNWFINFSGTFESCANRFHARVKEKTISMIICAFFDSGLIFRFFPIFRTISFSRKTWVFLYLEVGFVKNELKQLWKWS